MGWPKAWEFLLVYRLLGHLYQAQGEGRSLGTMELLDLEPGISTSRMATILKELMDAQLITQDHEDSWMLKRDLSRYTLRDLYRAGDYHLPIGKELPVPTRSRWDTPFMQLLNRKELDMEETLASLYESKSPDQEAAL